MKGGRDFLVEYIYFATYFWTIFCEAVSTVSFEQAAPGSRCVIEALYLFTSHSLNVC